MQTKVVNSLEKIYPDREPMLVEGRGSALKGDAYSFQLAVYFDGTLASKYNRLEIDGALAAYTTVRTVEYVSVASVPGEMDDYYEGSFGIYPDVLRPLTPLGIVLSPKRWTSLWITVRLPKTLAAGAYKTALRLVSQSGELLAEASHELRVIDAVLPESELILTNWVHYDAIARAHSVKLFGRDFYRVFDRYLRAYVEGGYNTLLTPLFTPPLDTEVDTERMTAQLVDVTLENGEYRFGFERLKKFIRFALRRGVKYIEFSHLFTQWGGKACPKIVAVENGKEKRIFGWDTPSTGDGYRRFLDAFLPSLVTCLSEMGVLQRTYFHLTDEPGGEVIEKYKECRALVKGHIGDRPVMDALSHYEFYRDGLVDMPFVILPSYARYVENGASDVGVYNCCGPTSHYYSNRFINMPSQRLRVLGMQIYKSGATGYLHWGYNFYNSALSRAPIDPYGTTDALGCFPAGDGFIVYPGDGGPVASIRYEVAAEGFRDERALRLLERRMGREAVTVLLAEHGIDGYTEYPHSAAAHIALREKINELIEKTK